MSFFNLLIFGSEEEIIRPTNNYKTYVEGEIVVGLTNSLSFEEFLDTVFPLGEIKNVEVSNINYSTDLPENKKEILEKYLSQFDFIDRYSRVKYLEDDKMWNIEFWISGFGKENISDWYKIVKELNLKHIPNRSQSVLLRVEKGKEKYWINKLSALKLFRYVDLNYITTVF